MDCVVHAVAEMMKGFYEVRRSRYSVVFGLLTLLVLARQTFAEHVGEKGPERGWDVQNGDVPFEKLYLLELRWIEKQTFQAVLSYDAD